MKKFHLLHLQTWPSLSHTLLGSIVQHADIADGCIRNLTRCKLLKGKPNIFLSFSLMMYFSGYKYLDITFNGDFRALDTRQFSGKTLPWKVRCDIRGINKSVTRVGSIYIPGSEDTLPKPQSEKDLEINLNRRMLKENYSIYLYTSTNSIDRLVKYSRALNN